MQLDLKPRVGDVPPATLLRNASLFLDFDGTLVDIADRPDAVIVDDTLQLVLRQLDAALDGRLAVVTGRPLDQIAGLLGIDGLALAGSHGAEMQWRDGRRRSDDRPAWLDPAIAELRRFGADHPGVLIEDKPFGVALHYRRAPDAEAEGLALAARIAAAADIRLQHGKMVVELRAPGADKGDAVRAFMADAPMAGTRPIVIGDDLTDEAAFRAARDLDGFGILVGEARDSDAHYRIDDVAGTIAWLRDAAEALA